MMEFRGPYVAVPFDTNGAPMPPFSIRQQSTVIGAWATARGSLDASARAFALYADDGALIRIGVIPPDTITDDPDTSSMALDADGTRLVTGHADGNLRYWDLASGDPIWMRAPADEPLTGVAMIDKGPWIVAWSDDGPLLIFARESGELVNRIEDPQIGAFVAVPSDDGTEIAMTGTRVVRIALPGGQMLAMLDREHESASREDEGVQWIAHLAKAGDIVGARASESADEIVFWNGGTGERVATIASVSGIAACDVSSDRTVAAIGTSAKRVSVSVIDAALRTVSRTIELPHDQIHDLRFAHGNTLLVADKTHGITRVDVATGAISPPFDRDGTDLLHVAIEENATHEEPDTAPLMITRDAAGRLELTRLVARGPFGPEGRAVSGDGRRYAMIDERLGDAYVTVFDVERGVALATMPVHHPVDEIWLSRDGTRVAARAGGHVTVWLVPDAPAVHKG